MEISSVAFREPGKIGQYSEVATGGMGWLMVEYIKILNQCPNCDGKMVLELGVGPGSVMPWLRNKFGDKVSGMNIQEILERGAKVRKGLLAKGVKQNFPVSSNSKDVIVALHIFEPEDLGDILDEIERMLIPGGEATVVIPVPEIDKDLTAVHMEKLRTCKGMEKLLEVWKTVDGKKAEAMWKKSMDERIKSDDTIDRKLEIKEARIVSSPEMAERLCIVTLKKTA